MINYGNTFSLPGFGNIPPPPTPPSLIPHQVSKSAKKYDVFSPQSIISQPAVVSAKPTLYSMPATKAPTTVQQTTPQSSVDFMALQNEVEKKLKKLKNEKVSAELAISQG